MNASTDLMHTLAWSLLHFLWQGAAIAALAAAVMALFRESTTRYLIGIAALVLMVASFATTFALLNDPSISRQAEFVAAAPAAAVADVPADLIAASPAPSLHSAVPINAPERDFAWVARAWLAGVCLLALRIAFGLLLLEHLRRRNLSALPVEIVAKCRALQRQLGISRLVRYCECRLVTVPSVIGFVRPIVLLPVRALTGLSAEQLEAVIAHELGHVKRFDVAVNFFQVVTETLFFFHPAVWWLNKRIRADREDCCDDVAVAACGRNVSYARALATMEDWLDVPAFAMAATGSPVAARVARLLGIGPQKSGARNAGVFTASLVLAGALLAGAASVGIARPALKTPGFGSFAPLVAQIETVPEAAVVAAPAAAPAPAVAPKPRSAPAPKPPRAVPAKPAVPAVLAQTTAGATSSQAKGPSFIDEMASAGFDHLDVDQLIALRVQGVTAEYVRAMRSTGFELDVDQVVGMKVQDVTPEYVAQMRALGFKPTADEIVGMKVQGITPEYVKAMRDAGLGADADQMMAMKVQDVTPEYRKALEAAGYKLNVDELIEAKVMDVTPEFIAQVRAHGFKNLSIDQIIQLKNADVL